MTIVLHLAGKTGYKGLNEVVTCAELASRSISHAVEADLTFNEVSQRNRSRMRFARDEQVFRAQKLGRMPARPK